MQVSTVLQSSIGAETMRLEISSGLTYTIGAGTVDSNVTCIISSEIVNPPSSNDYTRYVILQFMGEELSVETFCM